MPGSNARSKSLSVSAVLILIGMFLSGPVGSYIVQLISPEPAWVDAKTYIQHYTELQSMPYFFGFVLMLGFILFFASLPRPETDAGYIKIRLTILCAGLYTFMISLNYMIQIVLVPNVLDNPRAIELVATLNAKSLFWYIEMTGYGFLGLATWSAGLLFGNTGREKIIKWLCIANGMVSVAGSVLTFAVKGWVLTVPGLICYVLWNILVSVLMVFILLEFRFGRIRTS